MPFKPLDPLGGFVGVDISPLERQTQAPALHQQGQPEQYGPPPAPDEASPGGAMSLMPGLAPSALWRATQNETMGAAFRQHNLVTSLFASQAWTHVSDPIDPNFDPYAKIAGTPYEQHWARFSGAANEQHFEAIKADIDREQTDRSTLDKTGWSGMAASMAAGTFDLPSLLPGGAIVRNAKGGVSIGRSAFSTAKWGAIGVTASEAGLQAVQQTRPWEESAFSIAGGTILAGVLGAGFGKLFSVAERRAMSMAVEKDLAGNSMIPVRATVEAAPGASPQASAVADAIRQTAEEMLPGNIRVQVVDKLDMAAGGDVYTLRNSGKTETPEFKSWFGESKVVDDDGKPVVVYHGSGDISKLTEFDPKFTGQGNDQLGSGFYFSNRPETASNYTTRRLSEGVEKLGGEDASGVVPAHLSIKNPIELNGSELVSNKVSITAMQAESIIKRSPDLRDAENSPIGNWHDIWNGGVKEWMIKDVAKSYAGNTLVSLENDFFKGDKASAFRKAVRDVLGYDGVVQTFDSGEKHFVAWFPEQIKSVYNRGTFDPKDPRISYSLRGFYNPAIRAVDSSKLTKGSGDQWAATLRNTPGVQARHLEELGIGEWLREQKGPVSKAELLAEMQAREAPLEENILGESKDKRNFDSRVKDVIRRFWDRSDERKYLLDFKKYAKSNGMSFGQTAGHIINQATRFGIDSPEMKAAINKYNLHGDNVIFSNANPFGSNVSKPREFVIRDPRLTGQYDEPHFHGPVLVHMRTWDIPGPKGEKLLGVGEIQSTLHQEGRARGYAKEFTLTEESRIAELGRERDSLEAKYNSMEMRDAEGDLIENTHPEAKDVWEQLSRVYNEIDRLDAQRFAAETPVPAGAPLKGDAWLELGIKRMLQYAAENGYDGVTWARSDQIAKAVSADAEKMVVQYDQKIASYLKKYGKKWGAQVEAGERIAGEGHNQFIRISDQMRRDIAEGQPYAMRHGPNGSRVAEGSFSPQKSMITIAAHALDPEKTLKHESIHALRSLGLLTDQDWGVLEREAAKAGWVESAGVKALYEDVYAARPGADVSRMMTEEAIAEQFSLWRQGYKEVTGAIAELFQRIKDFLERTGNKLRGLGYQTADDVFSDVASGRVAKRGEVMGAGVPRLGGAADAIGAMAGAGSGKAVSAGAAATDRPHVKLQSALGLDKYLAFPSPELRLFNSESQSSARTAQELVESSMRFEQNRAGIESAPRGSEMGTPGPVETRVKMWNAKLYGSLQVMDDNFLRYRKGREPRTGDMTGARLGDALSAPAEKLEYFDFKREVSAAMRNDDEHEIPEVAATAKHLRAELFDPLAEAAVAAKLLAIKDMDVKTAKSYLTRMHNKEAISAKRNTYVGIVEKWLKETDDHNLVISDRLRKTLDGHDKIAADIAKAEAEAETLTKRATKTGIQIKEAELAERRALAVPAKTPKEAPTRYTGPALSQDESEAIVGFWKFTKEMAKAPKPETLTKFIVKGGGVEDLGGDIKSMIGRLRDKPGLVSKSGNRIDDVAHRAWEAGFFPGTTERPTINEFLDKIAEDLQHGNVVREEHFSYFEDIKISGEMANELRSYGIDDAQFRSEKQIRDFLVPEPAAAAGKGKGAAGPAESGRIGELRAREADTAGKIAAVTARISTSKQHLAVLQKELEEHVAKYEGKTAAEAKRALKDRAEAEDLRAAKAAADGKEAPASRLRGADGSVMDAARAIAAKVAKEPGEHKALAQEITDRLLSTPAGRLPYDAHMNHGEFGPSGPADTARGPLAARPYMIPDERIKDFLENDIETIARHYVHTMASDVEIARRFDGDVEMKLALKEVLDDYARLGEQAASEIKDPKKLKARNEEIQKRRDSDIEDISAIRDRIRGTYDLPKDPSGIGVRTIRVLKHVNVLSHLGGMTISAISDIAKPVFVHGVLNTVGDGLIPLFRNWAGAKVAMREVKMAGTAWEMASDMRAMRQADIWDDFAQGTKFERGITAAARNFGVLSLMSPWNEAQKLFGGMVSQTSILRAAEMLAAGTATPKQIEALAASYISRPNALKIAEQFAKHGQKDRGIWSAGTINWDREARPAIEAFRAALVREVDKLLIVTPGMGDRPLFMSGQFASLAMQFKTFNIISLEHTLISGLQRRDMAALNGAILMVAMGGLVSIIKAKQAGKQPDLINWNDKQETARFLVNAVDWSGLAGWLMDANGIAEKVTGGRVGLSALTGKPMSRYASRNSAGTLMGPSLGTVQGIFDTASAISAREFSQRDVHTLRRLLPYQNLFYLRKMFDKAEEGINEKFGIRKTVK